MGSLGLICSVALCASTVIEWDFPRLGNCFEGLPFADGVTGVQVWGGGDTVNLTVGRADLWDNRGGSTWRDGQSYSNIVSLVRSDDRAALLAAFAREPVPGEPVNPYLLPLGRVVVRIPGATLVRGELDTGTGLGKLVLGDGREVAMAMSTGLRLFAMRLPEGLACEARTVSAMSFPEAREALLPIGFKEPEEFAAAGAWHGFRWRLPADPSVTLAWAKKADTLFVRTARGDDGDGQLASGQCSFDAVCEDSRNQWARFWKEGARIRVPDPVVQRIYDYGMYKFGAMTDPEGVPAGLQGPWIEDFKLPPWNGDYHFNINVQECYAPAYRGGHFAHLKPLFRMVLSWRPILRENARKFAGIPDGYVLPHSVSGRGVCIGGCWSGTIDHGSTAWAATMMAKYARYSGDADFLRAGGYDFMKGAMNVYLAMMEEYDGRLSIPLAPSPEWGFSNAFAAPGMRCVGRDPSFQLAAAHRLARDLIWAAETLGEAPDPRWREVEARLPAYTSGEGGLSVFEDQPFTESHRHHSHLAGLFPFDTIDLSDKRTAKIVDKSLVNWTLRGTGSWTGWCVPWASVIRTHAGHARAAVGLLHDWERYYCDEGHGSHHDAVFPGFTSWLWARPIMQMDGQCAAAAAVLELLAHEVGGKTEFFRGCPPEWKDVSFENLALSDGTRVSGRRLNGRVTVKKSTTRKEKR